MEATSVHESQLLELVRSLSISFVIPFSSPNTPDDDGEGNVVPVRQSPRQPSRVKQVVQRLCLAVVDDIEIIWAVRMEVEVHESPRR
jgi:hypothetical protein